MYDINKGMETEKEEGGKERPVNDQAGAQGMTTGTGMGREEPGVGFRMEKRMAACFSALTGAAGSCGDISMGANLKRKMGEDLGGLRLWGSVPSSPNNSVLDLTWDEDRAMSVWKKQAMGDVTPSFDRPGLEGSGALARKIRETIKNIDKEVRAVAVAAKERNTKKEIKEGAKALRSLLSLMMSGEVQELLQTLGKGGGALDKGNEPTLKEIELAERLESVEARIRNLEDGNRALCEENISLKAELGRPRMVDKDTADRLARLEQEVKNLKTSNRELKEENARLRTDTRSRGAEAETVTAERIRACKSKEEWQELEKLHWPEKIFTSVFAVEGSPMSANADADLLMLDEDGPEADRNSDLRGRFVERFPELKNSSDDLLAATVCTTYKDGQGVNKTNVRHILRMSTNDDLYDAMARVRDLMVDRGRGKLAAYPPGSDPRGTKMRKLMECVFKDTPVKCLLYKKGGSGTGKTRKTLENSEALVVRREGASYAELLRTVKSKVRPESEAAGAIRTIRESRDGGMVIVLSEQSTEKKQSLLREMANLEGVIVKQTRRNRGDLMNITDIGHDVTEEEISEALIGELGLGPEEVNLSPLRSAYGGNRATTVRLPKTAAERLAKKGGLRIGLNWCPARIREEVVRCFRCWQFGHIGRDCRAEEDGSNLCRRCGGTGHQARNCDGAAKCLTCKQVGHLAGSGKCPEFRKALDRARQRANKRKKP